MIELSIFLEVFSLIVLIFRVYCYISISILPFVLYNSFFESRYKPNSNYYHKKEWYHILKVLWAKSAVKKFKKSFEDAIKNESDESLEKPRKLTTFMRSDNQVIYGVDQQGNSLYLRITLREKRLAELCVQIRLADGKVYQLPEHPSILLSSIPERQWRAGGLEITVIEPFASLRITYNGFLRNAIRTDENDDIGEVTHCQFNFIWCSATEVKFFPQGVSTHELAEAVAVEPWRDAKWIKLLGYHTGYDQYGSLHGHFTYSSSSSSPNTSFLPFPSSCAPPTINNTANQSDSFTGTSFTPSPMPDTTDATNSALVYTKMQLRLSACRKRAWGPREARVMHRMLTLFGADGRGFGFNVGVRSYSNGCKELHIGSTMLPNRKILFIEDCDISLPDFFEDGYIPGAFTFSFKAAGKHYKCTAFTYKSSIADMRNEEMNGYNGKLVKTKYIINGEEASGYGVFWYSNQGKGLVLPPYIIRPGIQTIEPERKYVASLASPECRSVYLAGVKGTSLTLLTAIQTDKFNTLDGFCILAPALAKHLEKNPQIKTELTKLNDISCGTVDGNLQEACDRVQNLFISTSLHQHFHDLVVRELTLLKFSSSTVATEDEVRWCWAVRGSIVHQDNVEKPAELRDRTFLDCFSDEDVMKAVTRCWASVYDYKKVLYRRKRGLPIICDMALVVQHTLDADTAGILTTMKPETGNLGQITVTANYGLGVSLLTPTIIPDTLTITRTWDNHLSVSTLTSGSKTHRVIIGDDGITKVANNNSSGLCLSKELLLQIARVGLDIEKALGGPVKIEWTVFRDLIYIISSTLLTPPFSLCTSPISPCVNNTPILSPHDCILLHSTDNLLQGSDPCCALTSTISLRYLDQALQKVYDGKETNRGGYRKLGVMEGVVGVDVFQTILRNVDKDITEELKIHELVTTGRWFVTDEVNQEAVYRNRVTKWTDTVGNLYRTLTYCWNSADNAEEATLLSQAIKMTAHPDSSGFEHFKIIKRNLHLLKHIIHLHTAVNQSYVFYQKLFLNLMHDEESDLAFSAFQRFLGDYSSSTVYQTGSRVELLAAVLRNRHLGAEFSALEPGVAVPWLEEHAGDCVELIERIMEEIGFRGVNEFDFASEPWESNTFALIRIVQMLIQKMEKDNKTEGETCENIAGKSAELKNKMNGKILRWLDTRLHNIFERRFSTQEAVTRAVNKFRWAYLELGRRLMHEGKLPAPGLILHLTHQEVEAVVVGKRPDLVDRAMKRAIRHKTSNPNIPDIYTGAMATVLEQQQQPGTTFEQQQQHQRVIGNTVVSGNAAGRVCVLENIRQVEFVQPDDILVTKSLDLSWSPYFGLLSGLICETGSLISQGAIAVYKQNLPCIVAKHATSIFKTGDQVMMFGNTGVVEKILSKET